MVDQITHKLVAVLSTYLATKIKKTEIKADIPVLPDPGEELFSSLLEEEERTPPDVFSDLSTVLLSIDLGEGWEVGGEGKRWRKTKRRGRKGQIRR